MRRQILAFLALFAGFATTSSADDLRDNVAKLFAADNPNSQRECAKAIAASSSSKDLLTSAKLGALLHRDVSFANLKPGTATVDVALEDGTKRTVFVRIPAGYSADRAYPLIVAFHGTGGNGHDLIEPLVRILGKSADEFLIAGVDQYLNANIDSQRTWRPEHRLVLQSLKTNLHVNSDRVYVVGFSGGGYVAWSHALYFGDQYAAAIPVACAFDAAPEIPGFWEMLLPNIKNMPVMNVWGADDRLPVMSIDLQSSAGTNNVLNKRLEKLAREMKINTLQSVELPGVGHAFAPPVNRVREMFSKTRTQFPEEVSQRFRYLCEGHAYWLEALAWEGDSWRPAQQEADASAMGKMIDQTLATLNGKIDGQTITIQRKHVAKLAMWIGEGMIDFDKPVKVIVNGKTAFEGKLNRDLGVALLQARRTHDFDRICWAGLLIDAEGAGRAITIADEFPEVVWERPR